MFDIVTVGEVLVEILTEKVNQVFYKSGKLLGPYPSGAPAIFIDQAARMGAKTTIFAKVGRDDFARINLDRLSSNGVDVSNIAVTDSNSTGVAFVTYFEDGSRQFIFHFSKAACGELCVADLDDTAIKSAQYLHIMGCSITSSPTMREAIMHAVRTAKQAGVRISFDPNIRPELVGGAMMDYYNEIIEASDVLLTGRSELKLLYGDDTSAIKQLLEQKDRIVVVKDGSRGTQVYTRTEAFKASTYPAIEVDPTGAGDCFDATFLAAVCAGIDLRTSVKRGNAAGAMAVSKRGPMEGNSTITELNSFIDYCDIPEPTTIDNPYQSDRGKL